MRLGEHHVFYDADHDMSSATDALEMYPVGPIRIIRWGFMSKTLIDIASMSAELNVSTYDGATTATETASGGKVLTPSADTVIGEMIYCEPSTEVIVRSGDLVQIEVTAAASSGTGVPFVEYQQLPFDKLGETALFNDDSTNKLTDCST